MRTLALLAILVAVALVATACGSGDSGSGSAGSTATERPPVGNRQAFARFQQCLEDQGVEMPSGPPDGSQQDQGQPPTLDAKTQAAIQACRQYLPEDLQGQGGFGG